MKLTNISFVKSMMTEQRINFKKKFGQNFLISENVITHIADSLTFRDNVIEIGPGAGALTYRLCETCKSVTAVEIDRQLIPALEKNLGEFKNLKLICGDFLKTDINELTAADYAVAANLPYYITTPIIMYLLELQRKPEEMVIMVQKEVADRLCSSAGDDDYGAITATVAWYGKAKKLFNISAGNFIPAPKIDSAVIKITPYKTPLYEIKNEELLKKIIKGAFGQRRKTLANALAGEFNFNVNDKKNLTDLIVLCGYSENIRGEKLDIYDFVKLANAMYDSHLCAEYIK